MGPCFNYSLLAYLHFLQDNFDFPNENSERERLANAE